MPLCRFRFFLGQAHFTPVAIIIAHSKLTPLYNPDGAGGAFKKATGGVGLVTTHNAATSNDGEFAGTPRRGSWRASRTSSRVHRRALCTTQHRAGQWCSSLRVTSRSPGVRVTPQYAPPRRSERDVRTRDLNARGPQSEPSSGRVLWRGSSGGRPRAADRFVRHAYLAGGMPRALPWRRRRRRHEPRAPLPSPSPSAAARPSGRSTRRRLPPPYSPDDAGQLRRSRKTRRAHA